MYEQRATERRSDGATEQRSDRATGAKKLRSEERRSELLTERKATERGSKREGELWRAQMVVNTQTGNRRGRTPKSPTERQSLRIIRSDCRSAIVVGPRADRGGGGE